MSVRVAGPELGSAGLPLAIGATLAAGAGPVPGVGAAVGAGEAGAAAGVGAGVEVELDVSAGGALAVDEVSEVVCCGAGLLTVVVVSTGVSAVGVEDEPESVVVDAWSAGGDAGVLGAGAGFWPPAVSAGVDDEVGAAGGVVASVVAVVAVVAGVAAGAAGGGAGVVVAAAAGAAAAALSGCALAFEASACDVSLVVATVVAA